jgi:hypothetical protein
LSSKATQGVTLVAGTNTDAMDDFVAAWDIANSAYQPAFVLVSALFALTSAGERPVAVDRLAATVRRPVAETRALAGSLGELVRLDNADVHLVLGTSSPSPRFLVRIGDRTIKAGGCAPDLFWIAVCSGKTVRVDTECQASGAPIHVEIDPDGVTVEPPTTVVAVVHPGRQPELMDTIDATITNTAGPDEDFCYHQPFFAAPDAGATWLAAHPGGRLFTVAEFLEFWRRVTIETLGKATVDSALTR